MSSSDHSSDRSAARSSAEPAKSNALSFGPFAFDVVASRLSRDGIEIHLTPKAAAVLGLLLQRPGDLISKDEFLETVWEDVHVREESLTQAISVIRQALGDSAQSPAFIQTVSGEGYRFIPTPDRTAASSPPPDRRRIPTYLSITLLVVAMVVAGASGWLATRSDRRVERAWISLPVGEELLDHRIAFVKHAAWTSEPMRVGMRR
jgi:DNA-binding winged helix-turn-helix (wHTH) protein